MGEAWDEQVARLRLMADERLGDKWDLSPNDRAAIRAALDARVRVHELLGDAKRVIDSLNGNIQGQTEGEVRDPVTHAVCQDMITRIHATMRTT